MHCAVATTIATTTSPAKGIVDSLAFLKDATAVQNAVAAASAAVSSLTLVFDLAPFNALGDVDFVAAGLKSYTIHFGFISER
jgi:hypothetical protein